MDYAVWLWNRLPTIDSGYSPEELFSRSQSTHVSLNRARVWGSPLYVLDPRLQDGKEILKWEKRSTAGMFMGFPPFHSSTVSLALNLTTGNVSPQFHVVHDELFTTAHNFGETNMSALWDNLPSLVVKMIGNRILTILENISPLLLYLLSGWTMII